MYFCASVTTALSEAVAVELPEDVALVGVSPAAAAACAQSPEPVDVSTGPATTTVPDVQGDSEEQATTKLEAAGFVVDRQTEVVDNDRDVGNVIDQNPAGNRDAPAG